MVCCRSSPTTRVSTARLGELGRATQNLVGSLDAGLELAQGTTSYVYLGRAIRPRLDDRAGAPDGALAVRDRNDRSLRAVQAAARSPRSCRAQPAPSASSSGATPACCSSSPPSSAPSPRASRGPSRPKRGLYQPSPVVLAVLGLLLLIGWLVARERLIPPRPARLEETIAGHTVALLTLGLIALVLVATNPFSLSTCCRRSTRGSGCPDACLPPDRARTLLTLGLTGPVILTLSFATRFDLGCDAPWYLLSLVAAATSPGSPCCSPSSGSQSARS